MSVPCLATPLYILFVASHLGSPSSTCNNYTLYDLDPAFPPWSQRLYVCGEGGEPGNKAIL